MKGLQGFASQATAAYAKLGQTIEKIVPIVGNAAQVFGNLREELKQTVPQIEAANNAFARMRNLMAVTVPLMAQLNAQLSAMGINGKVAGNLAASGISSVAKSAATANMTLGATSGSMMAMAGPLAAFAALATVVYVTLFKWQDVPGWLKVIMLALMPVVGLLRVLVNIFNTVTLPIRAAAGAFRFFKAAVTETIKQTLLLPITIPKVLATVTASIVRFGAAAVRTLGGLVVGAFRSVVGSANSVLGVFSRVGGVMSGVANDVVNSASRITRPLADAGRQFAAAGTAAAAMAAAAGMGVGSVQALGYAAERSGSSTEDMVSAVKSLNKASLDAASGTGEAAAMMRRLGLDVAAVTSASPEQRFALVGQAIRNLADPAERAAAATALLGSESADLLKMFDRGLLGLSKFNLEADKMGLIMSGPQASAAVALTKAQEALKNSYRGLWQQLGAAVAPAMTAAAEQMALVIQAVTRWVKLNPQLIDQVFRVASRVVAIASAVATFGSAMAVATPGLIALTGAAVAGYAAWDRWGTSIKAAYSSAVKYLGDLYTEAQAVLGGIYDAIAAGDLMGAVNIAFAGAKKAWAVGLSDLATISGDAFGGILNSLAAGDWSSAAEQATDQIKIAFESLMGYLDDAFTGLKTTLDGVVVYLRQQMALAIQQIAIAAQSGVSKMVAMSKTLEAYDPTGKLQSARLDVELAISKAGLGALTKDPTEANDKLAAAAEERRLSREADLAAREQVRNDRIEDARNRATKAQDAASFKAGQARVVLGGDLQSQLDAARQAAQMASTMAAMNAEQDRKGKLLAAASQATPGFGAQFSAASIMALAGSRETAQERTAKAVEALPGKIDKLIELDAKRLALEKATQLEFVA